MKLQNLLYDNLLAPIFRGLGCEIVVHSTFSPVSYIRRKGWVLSGKLKKPVDAQGKPVPWINYSAIDFIASRVESSWRVFEYGSGFSTLWWAARAGEVAAVEHDKDWFGNMSGQMPSNARLFFSPLDESNEYQSAITREAGAFDVVVIDGRRRVECAAFAVQKISERGVIIVDDYEREQYRAIGAELAAKGWHVVTFSGMKPCDVEPSTAAVFYRHAANVLGL